MKPAMPTSSSVRVDVDAQLMQAEGHVDQFPRDLLDCGAGGQYLIPFGSLAVARPRARARASRQRERIAPIETIGSKQTLLDRPPDDHRRGSIRGASRCAPNDISEVYHTTSAAGSQAREQLGSLCQPLVHTNLPGQRIVKRIKASLMDSLGDDQEVGRVCTEACTKRERLKVVTADVPSSGFVPRVTSSSLGFVTAELRFPAEAKGHIGGCMRRHPIQVLTGMGTSGTGLVG